MRIILYVPRFNVDIQYLFLDDDAKDNPLCLVKGLTEQDKQVHYVSFFQYFGKEAAPLGTSKQFR